MQSVLGTNRLSNVYLGGLQELDVVSVEHQVGH